MGVCQNHPASPFVADFIGNANFIEAVVEDQSVKTVTVTLQGRSLELEKTNKQDSFSSGERVTLSIKPEAVDISDEPTGFTGRLDVSSFLGSVTELKVEFEESFITVLHSNTRHLIGSLAADQPVNLEFNKKFFRVYKR